MESIRYNLENYLKGIERSIKYRFLYILYFKWILCVFFVIKKGKLLKWKYLENRRNIFNL